MTKIKFVIPFDDIQDGEWKLFFPFKTVYHYRQKIKFTPKRGAEMVGNFGKVPDYELPINTLHDDALGVFGYIKSLRIGDYGIEWLPEFNEGAVEKIKEKGYKYASPEVIFDGFPGVDGKEYDNVALGIAITPRPRLGKDTLVFSDGEWTIGDDEMEDEMPDVTLNDEQMGELKEGIFAQLGKTFTKFWNGKPESDKPEPEPEPEPEPIALESEDDSMEFAEQLKEKEQRILELEEAQKASDEALKALEDKAQKYDEQIRVAEEEAAQARQATRKLEFAEVAKKVYGLPEMETEFADELMWLEDADTSDDKVHYNALMNVLLALGNQEKMAELFSEKGVNSNTPTPVEQKIEKMVAVKVKEGMSVSDAYQLVLSENPELYTEYSKANTKTDTGVNNG